MKLAVGLQRKNGRWPENKAGTDYDDEDDDEDEWGEETTGSMPWFPELLSRRPD